MEVIGIITLILRIETLNHNCFSWSLSVTAPLRWMYRNFFPFAESVLRHCCQSEGIVNFKHLVSSCCTHAPILRSANFNLISRWYKLSEQVAAIPDTSISARYLVHDRIRVGVEVFHNDSLKIGVIAHRLRQTTSWKSNNGGDGWIAKALSEDFRSDEASTTGEYEFHGFGFSSKSNLKWSLWDAPFYSARYKSPWDGRISFLQATMDISHNSLSPNPSWHGTSHWRFKQMQRIRYKKYPHLT